MITKYPQTSKMLTIQYRMNKDIMKWSSESMYGGELVAAPEVENHLLKDNEEYKAPASAENEDEESLQLMLNNSLYLIDTSFCKMFESVEADTSSKYNIGEASLV